jgi:hypothetical protein
MLRALKIVRLMLERIAKPRTFAVPVETWQELAVFPQQPINICFCAKCLRMNHLLSEIHGSLDSYVRSSLFICIIVGVIHLARLRAMLGC